MLWVDKHRPVSLDKLDYHDALSQRLTSLAESADLPHLLFYGPAGAGKETRVAALLRAMFGPASARLRQEHRAFKTPSNRTVDITMVSSNVHIKCNPADAGNNDCLVIQEVIKEIAASPPIPTTTVSTATATASSSSSATSRPYKVVVLTEVNRLSRQAQAALRRTMEKYSATCRLILMCNSISEVIDPLRSRCLCVRVPAPRVDDIARIVQKVTQKEHCPCPDGLAREIAIASGRDLRKALLMVESCHVQSGVLRDGAQIQLTDWELYIGQLATEITSEQSPAKLLSAREMLYELLTNCIPANIILQTLARCLFKTLDDQLKHEVAYWAAFYDHRLAAGNKEIFHLEAFVAKFMSIYKRFVINLFAW